MLGESRRPITELLAELSRLKRELAEARMERDILTKRSCPVRPYEDAAAPVSHACIVAGAEGIPKWMLCLAHAPSYMGISTKDIIPLTTARAKLTDLCEEVHTHHTEKILTKNGESCAALIDADRLDYYHRLEREHIYIALIQEAITGMQDFRSRKVLSVKQLKARHGR